MKDLKTEAEQIRDIRKWPRWPWLPMKRYHGEGLELGVVYADDVGGENDGIRVFNINIVQTSVGAAIALTNGAECPWPIHKTYQDVEAMVDDGWVGD